MHLYLGKDAYDRVLGKPGAMTDELEVWKSYTISADY
jgi:hypothetical protein